MLLIFLIHEDYSQNHISMEKLFMIIIFLGVRVYWISLVII
jgi:hypothetical protein